MYDTRLARFLSIDPWDYKYPNQSPYVFAHNCPIALIDYLGLGDPPKKDKVKSGEGLTQFLKRNGVNVKEKDDWLNHLENLKKANPEAFKGDYNPKWSNTEKWKYWNAQKVGEGETLNIPPNAQSKNSDNNQAAGYSPNTNPPRNLPGFPDAKNVSPKSDRRRWKLPNGDILEWDRSHGGEVERYDPRGKHIGVWSPEGEKIKEKVPGRRIEPIITPDPWYVPSPQAIKITVGVGMVVGGAAIIIFDVVTIPSGEGAIGVLMIGSVINE